MTGLDLLSGSVYFQSRTLTPPMFSQPLIFAHSPMTPLPRWMCRKFPARRRETVEGKARPDLCISTPDDFSENMPVPSNVGHRPTLSQEAAVELLEALQQSLVGTTFRGGQLFHVLYLDTQRPAQDCDAKVEPRLPGALRPVSRAAVGHEQWVIVRDFFQPLVQPVGPDFLQECGQLPDLFRRQDQDRVILVAQGPGQRPLGHHAPPLGPVLRCHLLAVFWPRPIRSEERRVGEWYRVVG